MVIKKYEDLTEHEKLALKEGERLAHIKWLHFIVKDKKEYTKKYEWNPKAVKILLRDAEKYQKELDALIGFTPEPDEFDSMSFELKSIYEKLYQKQCVLVACKKDKNYCDKIKAEIRQIEVAIAKQEAIEGKKQIDEVPF